MKKQQIDAFIVIKVLINFGFSRYWLCNLITERIPNIPAMFLVTNFKFLFPQLICMACGFSVPFSYHSTFAIYKILKKINFHKIYKVYKF